MINTEIKTLKEALLKAINDSLTKGVPVTVIDLVMENINLQLKPLVDQAIKQEEEQPQQEAQQEDEVQYSYSEESEVVAETQEA